MPIQVWCAPVHSPIKLNLLFSVIQSKISHTSHHLWLLSFFLICFDFDFAFRTGVSPEDEDELSSEEDELHDDYYYFFFLLVTILSFLMELLQALFHHWSFQSNVSSLADLIPRPCPSSLLLIWRHSVMPASFLPSPLPYCHPIFIISFLAYQDYTFLWLIPELFIILSLYLSAMPCQQRIQLQGDGILQLQQSMLTRRDPSNFRHTILCAIMAEQNIVLEDINMRRNPPGLKPEESTFLKLVESVSNGSKMIVAKGGTQMRFYAGMITNNEGVQFTFDCGLHRSIGYYLEYLLLISMFGKNSLAVNLTGVTNDNHDNSVDSIQQHLIPLLKDHYEFDNELSVKIIKRGYLPDGGGLVHVTIPTVRKLKRVNIEDKGYTKRIRGICAGSKISTSILNDIKDQVKTAFLDYLPDIWIYTDFYKGDKASLSSGYSLSLKAETTTGSIITFDAAYEGEKVEQFVKKTLGKFMDEIKYSGVISTNYQWFLLTLLALSEKKTSSVKLGRVSPFTIQCLRILRDFFGITFEIEQSKTDDMAIFRCLGIGYENYARIAN